MVFYTFYKHFKNNVYNIYKNFVCYLTGVYYTYITCPNVIKPCRQNAIHYDYENVLNNFHNLEKPNVTYFYDLSNNVVDENNNNHNNKDYHDITY